MNYLSIAIEAALKAGEKIMEVYGKDFEIYTKQDQSPLTEADKQSNEVILQFLEPTNIPVISEEIKNLPYQERAGWEFCWMVDPLDGTKEFIKKNGEFTVNIALIKNGQPVMGVVYWPVNRKLYFGTKEKGSFVNTVEVNSDDAVNLIIENAQPLENINPPAVYTIVASRSHLNEATEMFIKDCKEKYGRVDLVSRGSSLKLCMVAEGKAHVYPRLAPTMEWDTAAAHAVARFAGCKVLNFETKEALTYNKKDLHNPHFIVLSETM